MANQKEVVVLVLNRRNILAIGDKIYDQWRCHKQCRSYMKGTRGIVAGVYFFASMVIVAGELIPCVRIGQTDNIFKRKSQYRSHNSGSFYLIYFHNAFDATERKEVERYYLNLFEEHKLFNKKRSSWFHLKPVIEELGFKWEDFIER